MVQLPLKPLTLEEFLQQPESEPAYEYINGEIRQKPMPQGKHSILQRELCFASTVAFKPKKMVQALPELRCNFGGGSIVPDISIFRAHRIPTDSNGMIANAFNLSPDWIIEILSPNQNQTNVIRNILHYLDYETEYGWLVDPNESCLFVYGKNQSVKVFENTKSPFPVPAFAQPLKLSVKDIFNGLKI